MEDRGLEISRKNPVYPGSMEMETWMVTHIKLQGENL